MSDVNELKNKGNKAFQAKEYDAAIDLFSQAIKLDPKNHVLWSNRSAAQAGKRQWAEALADAEETIRVNPTWSKGFARKGAALHGANRWDDAIAAYEEGLKIENSDALQKGLREVKEAQAQESRGSRSDDVGAGIGNMFADPSVFSKLAANPKTAPYLADPSFVQKLRSMQQNPNGMQDMMADPRMLTAMGVLMGIDLNVMAGADDMPGMSAQPPTPPTSPPAASRSAPKPKEPEDVKMADPDPEDDEEAKAKKAAEVEKQKGSDAYKKRDFETAAKSFERAWELWPKDITFLTNLSAVYLEQAEYDKSIETSEKAVEEGRSIRADYKLVAKALGRIGTAYQKKGDNTNAIKWYEKSLIEHRTADVLNKLKEVERLKTEADKKAYIDPELSTKAREEGNAQFKGGDFAAAVKSYTESIKRDPSDPRGYNNRANAYTKLAALPEALKDAEQAVKVDPKFVKGYLRKSHVLYAMKEYSKAMQAAQEAMDNDDEKKHQSEIDEQLRKITMALYDQRSNETQEETLQRAMRDPDVARIMSDPVMQQILQQAQDDPRALQDHMKNPGIRANIEKLIAAGIIKTR